MVKGVNRHMIELTDVDSEYYEKAFFIVKPEYESVERDLLNKEAKKVLKSLGEPSYYRRAKKMLPKILAFSSSLLIGATLALLINNVFFK